MLSRAIPRCLPVLGVRTLGARSFHTTSRVYAKTQRGDKQDWRQGNIIDSGDRTITVEETTPSERATEGKEMPNIDTSGTVADLNAKIGGILGLYGAPTFTRGENVLRLIKSDHRQVEKEYEAYKNAHRDMEKRKQCAWNIIKMLVQHSEVEQMLVYPLLKIRGDDQAEHDRSLSEHQHVRELLYELDNTDIEDPSYSDKLKAVMDANAEHVKKEEEEVLPKLAREYSADELERLGSAFEVHKLAAPTHPHPSAPMQGPLAAAAGMAAKPLDLARDAIRSAAEKIKSFTSSNK